MKHEDTFFDSSLREALKGETPPDVLSRVLARSRAEEVQPREMQGNAGGRGAAGKVTTRRWVIARVIGALCLSVLAGGAVAFAASLFAPEQPADTTLASLQKLSSSLDEVNRRLDAQERRAQARAHELEVAERELAKLSDRLATPEEKMERAMVEMERRQRERHEQAELQRRERHLAWVQEVRKQQRKQILDEMTDQLDLNAEQQKRAGKVLDDWGGHVYGVFDGHYRGKRRHEPRETMDSVRAVNDETRNSLRALLDSRQQLAFDTWLGKGGGGALARGADPWLPPAVDLDDLDNFDEWRR